MYSKFVSRAVSTMALCFIASATQAATLGERAVYTVNILPAGHADEVGQCSAFVFGDISNAGCTGGFSDNEVTGTPALTGGDGIAADGLAGSLTIETSIADTGGLNTFAITAFQMDPYLNTAGGTFKTTMSAPDGAMTGSGTVDSSGNMTLDPTGRTGVAQFYAGTLGIQPWNVDDSSNIGTSITGLYSDFVTGSASNYSPGSYAPGDPGVVNLTLTGRSLGDANADGVLDAVLVSVGNVGTPWGFFDGTPYTEAFNVQFVLVSAKPVANDDTLIGHPSNTLVIDIANDLLLNDVHADPAEAISLFDVTQPTGANSSLIWDGSSSTMTFNPPDIGVATDTFTYTITDIAGNTHTATVTVNLATGNPPVANNDPLTADEDVATSIDPTLNDTDPNIDDVLSVISFDTVALNGGTITAGTGNELIYTSATNFFGADSFDYTITDGNGNIASATVNVTVNAVNDPLVCTDVDLVTDTDVTLDIDVAATLISTCTDIDIGDTPAFSTIQTPSDQGGTISFDGANTLTYTPASGFSGKDTFTYTAIDDGSATDVRTITVTVGITYDNFTMLQAAGLTFGGTNDVIIDWDGTSNTDDLDYANNLKFNVSIASEGPEKFNGFVWTAHTARVFGQGTYSFDTGCTVAEIQATGCPAGSAVTSGPTLTMTVDAGQIGVHMLFDWSTSRNIDVVNVYNLNASWDNLGAIAPMNELWLGAAGASPDPTTTWEWVSTDDDGDGIVGVPMIDGPFVGYSANFNKGPGSSGTSEQAPFTGTASDTKLGGTLSLVALLANLFALIGFRYFSRKRGRV